MTISRRTFTAAALALGLGQRRALAQSYAGLDNSAEGFATVVPGRVFSFPADLGPHPDYRIEWWYVTANLTDSTGNAYGAQWTLFRLALKPGGPQQGWANQQIWMGHAAVTRADLHRFSETFARGGVGQAGVDANPFHAWIDSWDMRGLDGMDATTDRAARPERIGEGFQLRAAARCRPGLGVAGRRRLQPQIGARTGLVLLQPAVLQGGWPPYHR